MTGVDRRRVQGKAIAPCIRSAASTRLRNVATAGGGEGDGADTHRIERGAAEPHRWQDGRGGIADRLRRLRVAKRARHLVHADVPRARRARHQMRSTHDGLLPL